MEKLDKMNSIAVLGLNNNFYGSYSSNQVYFEELIHAFQLIGVKVYTASTIEEAIKIYESINICFSFSFSKYQYYSNGIPLYEKYGILNYQWISDNPLKMGLDLESSWIKYIFIDREYPLVLSKNAKNEYLFRPLGFLKNNIKKKSYSNGRILFPCKVRNLNELYEQINHSKYSYLMKKFLERYDRSTSFIMELVEFFKDENVIDSNEKESIFRMTNEFTRVEKRLWVLERLIDIPIDVLSDDCENNIKNPNVHFIQPQLYAALPEIINKYSYVINVDPNYNNCIHDRFIRTISSGSICITNTNKWISSISNVTYTFGEDNSVMQAIAYAGKHLVHEEQLASILEYAWEESADIILHDYLKGKKFL